MKVTDLVYRQPSEKILKQHKVVLTGEFRQPNYRSNDKWIYEDSLYSAKAGNTAGPTYDYRRWIVKDTPKAAPKDTQKRIIRDLDQPKSKQYLVCKISSKGQIAYYRQPGNGLTVERSLAFPYTEERALEIVNLFPNLVFMTKA